MSSVEIFNSLVFYYYFFNYFITSNVNYYLDGFLTINPNQYKKIKRWNLLVINQLVSHDKKEIQTFKIQ